MSTLPGVGRLDGLDLRHPVWGVDHSTQAVSVGLLLPGLALPVAEVYTMRVKQFAGDPARRLAQLEDDLEALVTPLRNVNVPALALVEQPFGVPRKKGGGKGEWPGVHPQAFFVTGAILATLARVLRDVACDIDTIAPPTWRAAAWGKGNGNMRTVLAKAKAIEFAAIELGCPTEDDNEADALSIAVAGAFRLAAPAA